MIKRKIFFFPTFLLFLVISFSCKDITGPDTSLDSIVFPESNIDYYGTIQPLFNIGCATEGCHDVRTKASNLDLSSYLSLKQRFYDVVIARDTAKSRLIWSIEGELGASPMPPQRSLNANQIRGFKKWIMEGATDTVKTK